VTNKCGNLVTTLKTNNGGEYLSNEFEMYLKSKGMHHELTAPYTNRSLILHILECSVVWLMRICA